MSPQDPHLKQPVLRLGEPLAQAQGALILLHGRGAGAQDILGLAPELGAPGLAYLAPQAADHTWYPNSFLVPTTQNQPFLDSALAKVKSLVDEAVAAGIPTERIVLCGFSQGACLSTEFVARHPARYGGLIALTGGLIGTDQEVAAPTRPPLLDSMPALFATGDPDPHVPFARVEQSAAILRTMGAEVIVRRYPGRPHTVTRDEIDQARRIVAQSLS